MKSFREKMSFISSRVVAFTVATGIFCVFMLCVYIRLAVYGRAEVWPALVMAVGLGVLGAVCFFGIVRPYLNWKKQVIRFLDGYLPAQALNERQTFLTPYTFYEMRKVNEILNSAQVVNLNKRQAQYLALQNQINPHFLYNTLDGIRSEALIAGVDSVADMTEALAAFFRYTISKVENLVTVEEELDNCKTYFKIQQYRFGERLKLHIECEEEDYEDILHCLMPKLTLQPVLENSIIHGTELKIGSGNLTIHLERVKTRLLIRISDDGVGMEEESLTKLNRKLTRTAGQFATPEQERKGGIALVNVNNRIHLIFGEEYGMHVFSMKGIGTDVEITIPAISDEREIRKQGVLG